MMASDLGLRLSTKYLVLIPHSDDSTVITVITGHSYMFGLPPSVYCYNVIIIICIMFILCNIICL